jgi:hypothetical protein
MLEDIVMQKQVSFIMDFLNITLSVSIVLIYVYRTYDMCYFDELPVWKFYLDEDENFLDMECKGEGFRWYYSLLLAAHFYFLLEFILRLLVQKYMSTFLMSPQSFIEIFTTVPFLITLVAFGKSSYIFQFFVMVDNLRLFLFERFTKNIESEVSREVVSIVIKIFFINWIMAAFLQFVEN